MQIRIIYLTSCNHGYYYMIMIIDMHIHTHFSPCSEIDIQSLIQRARTIGLDGICITDHDTTASRHRLQDISDRSGLCVIVGMEYTTAQGDFLVFSHADEIPKGMDAWDLLKWSRKNDSVGILAHPYRKSRPAEASIIDSSPIIETMNGRNNSYENDLTRDWMASRGKGSRGTGGSDAHTIHEVGKVVTVFEKNIYGVEELIRELHAFHYGPYACPHLSLSSIH